MAQRETLSDIWEKSRERMVRDQLIARGIIDERVLAAMLTVPRERFVGRLSRRLVYRDAPVTIGFGQTISQPYIVARMCELLELTGDETVLDIGTGSGYQAAILSLLVKQVISVERVEPLAVAARRRLRRLGLRNIKVITGDGFNGYAKLAAYDAVISAAASRVIPPAWKNQLTDRGVMVFPLQKHKYQRLVRVTKEADTFTVEEFGKVSFVPLITGP